LIAVCHAFDLIPFLKLLVAGASFGLSIFTDVRYKVSQHQRELGLTKEQLKAKGWDVDKQANLLEEYQEMKDNLDIDNWENIRGPRPWEDDNTKYIELIEKRAKEVKEKQAKMGSFWAG